MFDSQKLSYQAFVAQELHHGVYVFTRDVCHLCQDYKKEIETINSHYLYFVECTTQAEQDAVGEITGRVAFPLTVGFFDNKQTFCKAGMLFGNDMNYVIEYIKRFGDSPLTPEQVTARVTALNDKKEIAFYLFPPRLEHDVILKLKQAIFNKYDEIAIDLTDILRYEDGFNRAKNIVLNYWNEYRFYIVSPDMEYDTDEILLLSEYLNVSGNTMTIRNISMEDM